MLSVLAAGLPGSFTRALADDLPGASVHALGDAEEVLPRLRDGGWGMLVMGPGVRGAAEVVRVVRTTPELRTLAVLLVAGEEDAGWLDGMAGARVDGVLRRPSDRRACAVQVAEVLGIGTAWTAMPEAPRFPAGSWDPGVAPALMRAVWSRSHAVMEARLSAVEVAVRMMAGGTLGPAVRQGAAREARKLVGTLGVFGSEAGAAAAETVVRRLGEEPGAPAGAAEMAGCLATLRAEFRRLDAELKPAEDGERERRPAGRPLAWSRPGEMRAGGGRVLSAEC
jgi:hypothetical protein